MGNYDESRRGVMAWQSSLAEMRAHGTLLLTGCGTASHDLRPDVEALIAQMGPDASLWGRTPPCARCGRLMHYMASAGPATPFRPLLESPQVAAKRELERRAFFRSLGLSRRDIVRIKALAEAEDRRPELCDLDVPIVVSVGAMPSPHWKALGAWVGRPLVFREMNSGERGVWERRPKGPRAL